MFRDKIREILELVLKAEEKNIYVAYNYDTNTKTLTIITKTKVFGTEIPMSVRASEVSVDFVYLINNLTFYYNFIFL